MRIEGNNVFLDNSTTVEQVRTITAVQSLYIASNVLPAAIIAIPPQIIKVSIIDNVTAAAVSAIPAHVQIVNIGQTENINAILDMPNSVSYITFSALPNQLIRAMHNNLIPQSFIDKALNVVPDNVGNLNVAHESEYSLEFWLAGTPEGRAILAVHNNPLARQINAQALNAVIINEPYAGSSLAHVLVMNHPNTKLQKSLLALRNIEVERLRRNAAIRKLPQDLIRMLPAMLWRTSFRSIIVEPEILDANNNRVGLRHRG